MGTLGPLSGSIPLNYDYKRYNNILGNSARKIASGSRLSTGEAPGDLRTAEELSSIVKKSDESARVLQNGIGILQTSSAWLDNIGNMVDALGRIAISAADETKTDEDRKILSHEFNQIKQELGFMATDSGKFNGIQTAGRTAISTWDAKDEKIYFSQPDGTDLQALDLDVGVDATDINGTRLNFVHTETGQVGDFLFSNDGEKLVYINEPPVTFNITQVGGAVAAGSPVVKATQTYLGESDFKAYIASLGELDREAMMVGSTAVAEGYGPHAGLSALYNIPLSPSNPNTIVPGLQAMFDQIGLSNIKVSSELDSSSGDYLLVLKSKDGSNIDLSHSDSTVHPGLSSVPRTQNVPALEAILGFKINNPGGTTPAEGDFTLDRNLSAGDVVDVMGQRITMVAANVTASADEANIGATKEQTAINLASVINSLTPISSATVDPSGSSTIHIVQETSYSNQELTAGVIQSLSVVDIETNTLQKLNLNALETSVDNSSIRAAKLTLDNDGNIWLSNPAPGSGYRIEKLHLDTMTLEKGGAGADNTFVGGLYKDDLFNRFSIYKDNAYYFDGDLNLVRRNLYDQDDSEILLPRDLSYNLYSEEIAPSDPKNPTYYTPPMYDISYGGEYFAWKSVSGLDSKIKVMNVRTKETTSIPLENSSYTVTGLEFDENNNLYWTATGQTDVDNAVFSSRIKWGDKPEIYAIEEIRNSQLGTLGGSNNVTLFTGNGFNVDGSSPASNFKLQSGVESGDYISLSVSNPSLTRLGIIDTDVSTFDLAEKSIKSLQEALTVLGRQQATLGSEINRVSYAVNQMTRYSATQATSLSTIKDTNLPKETAILTKAKMASEQSIEVLKKLPSLKEMALQILLGKLF